MFCSKCGNEIADDRTACEKCGAPIGAPPKESAEDPVASSAGSSGKGDDASSAKKKPGKSKAKLWIGIAAAVVVVVVGAGVGFNMYQAQQAEIARQEAQAAYEAEQALLEAKAAAQDAVDEALVAKDLAQDEEFMKGTASNDYVEEAPYAVSSFTLSDKSVEEGGDSIVVSGEAVIENGFFKEETSVTVSYLYDGQAYAMTSLEATSIAVEPLRGISNDAEHDLADIEGDLSGTSCTVAVSAQVEDCWFGKVERSTLYSYEFDGTKWTFTDEESDETITDVSGIYATYVDRRGGAAEDHGFFESFKISMPATGEVDDADIEFTWLPAERADNGLRMRIDGAVHYRGALYLSLKDGNVAFQGDVGGYPNEGDLNSVDIYMRGMTGVISPTGITFDESSEWIVQQDDDGYKLRMGEVELFRE